MMSRQLSSKQERSTANDRTSRVLEGAVKRLRRLGGRRASRDVKQAYREAATLVNRLRRK